MSALSRVGIIGGGQLGKMLAQDASKLGIDIVILDPCHNPPAASVAKRVLYADFNDKGAYAELARSCDVITFEREDVDVELLTQLKESGAAIYPEPKILAVLQDKLLQKQFLIENNIPTAPFERADVPDAQQFKSFGYPLVQKARRGGFDGRGVQVLESENEFEKALPVPSLIESCVDIHTEIAVIVARSRSGEVTSYPVAEMTLQSGANILDTLMVPARISEAQEHKAIEIATATINALQLVGVLGVELFIDQSDDILVNEISPRPHNSGHFTIEACVTSQYEQHLRAILGYPLGSTQLLSPTVMVNLLGEGEPGRPSVMGLKEALAIPGVSFHLYGKDQVSPGRKMGHVIILDNALESALEKAEKIKKTLKIVGVRDE